MKRREFLRNALTVSALAAVTAPGLVHAAEEGGAAAREYYELRAYRLKSGAQNSALDAYLQQALIPALNRLGSKPVGVFVEKEPKEPATVFVLVPYASLEAYAAAPAKLDADAEYQKTGAAFLQAPKSSPGFDRVDSWLMRAFTGLPRIELAAYSREGKARMFEMRTYESHCEAKARKKVEMFNNGEINTMREVGLAPVFYGQALVGPNLPHLTYMTSAENETEHKKHWDAFGKHPKWNQMKNDPQYADTVSKITKWFLVPTAYSQI